ncbi:uncharacterized protein RJT21DRAFT_122212 [Scheffersomyces amazonensis]|uniref:uncharacterized protein n=1 Tax=Scheffersomyces amazonensis TaxID=1078765 RepID=UPI00315CD4E6
MKVTNRVFYVIGLFLATQLSWTMALTHRKLELSSRNNAACILINSTSDDTSISFDFKNVKQFEVPLVVFEYRDIVRFRNLPNFNFFSNHSYVLWEGHDIVKLNNKSVEFELQLRKKDEPLPDSFFNTTVTDDSKFEYPVEKNGVYCTYLPLYKYGPNAYLPINYYVDIEVVNETFPINIFNDISSHVTLSIIFAVSLLFINFFHPAISRGQLTSLPIITKTVVYILIVNFIYNSIFFILEILCAYYPSDALYHFTEITYANLQRGLVDKLQVYISSLVYLGYGFSNLPVKVYLAPVNLLFFIHVATSLFGDFVVGNISSLQDILFLQRPFTVLYNTILVSPVYRAAVLNHKSANEKTLLYFSSIGQVGSEILLFLVSLIFAIVIWFKIRKEHPKSARRLLTSLLVHYFGYKLIIKQLLVIAIKISFAGFFDVGEGLRVFGNLIEARLSKLVLINLVELFIIWLFWGTNNPIDVRIGTDISEKKAAGVKKTVEEVKKQVKDKGTEKINAEEDTESKKTR